MALQSVVITVTRSPATVVEVNHVLAVGELGPQGLSAYQVAVAAGFSGTVGEWLISLIGDQGISAYEVAVEAGFLGTVEQWLISLIGARGPAGTLAIGNVTTGAAGSDVVITNTGTESAAVLDIQIPQGTKGDKGDQGDVGPSGGASAADVAIAINNATQISTLADDDKIGGTDTSASGVLGWISLTTLWTWIKVKLDAGLTVAGNWSFTSTTRPTSSGTGTPASNSLITQADADLKYSGFHRHEMYFAGGTWSNTITGSTPTAIASPMGLGLYLTNNSGGSAITCRVSAPLEYAWSIGDFGGSGYGGIDFGKVIELAFSFIGLFYYKTENHDWAVVLTTAGSTAGVAAMTPASGAKYIAIVCLAGNVTLQVCNGATKTTSATLTTCLVYTNGLFRMKNLGNGTVELYKNNTLVGSVSGAPTTQEAARDKLFFCGQMNASGAGGMRFLGIRLAWN